MSRRVSMDELVLREYWKPGEAARVLGRGSAFWTARFDAGEVEGYRTEKGHRHLLAESARAFLRGGGDAGAVESLAVTRRRLRLENLRLATEANREACARVRAMRRGA